MRSLMLFVGLLIAVAICPISTRGEETSQEPFGLKYVLPDAELAIVLEPAKIWADPIMRTLPLEVIETIVQRDAGFAIQDVDSVLLFVVPAHTEEDAGRIGFVFKMSRPMVWDEVFPEGNAGAVKRLDSPDKLKGESSPDCVFAFHAYTVDETTLVIGSPNALPEMFENSRQPPINTSLLKRLREQSSSSHAVIHFTPNGFKQSLRELWQQVDVYDAAAPLYEATYLLEHARLEIDLDKGVTLEFICPDEAAAVRLSKLCAESLDAMVENFDPSDIADANEHTVEMTLLRYQSRLAKLIRGTIKLSQSDNRVTLTTVGQSHTPEQLILAGVVASQVPSQDKLRTAIRRAGPMGRLREIGLAMHNYHDTYNHFPPRAAQAENGKRLLSWRVHLLPFLEERELYEEFHLDEPWDSEHNLKLVNRMPSYFADADPKLAESGKTRILQPVGEGMPGGAERKIGFAQVLDGTSNTIFAVEAPADRAVIWTQPEDLPIDANDPVGSLFGDEVQEIQVVMYDARTIELQRSMSADRFRALMTHASREPLDTRWDK